MVEMESSEENGMCCLIGCRIAAGYSHSIPSSLTNHSNKPEIIKTKMQQQQDGVGGKG